MTGKKIKYDGTAQITDDRRERSSGSSSPGVPVSESWIATVSLDYADEKGYDTQKRLDTLSTIIGDLRKRTPDASQGLVILPGGWIDAGEQKPEKLFGIIEQAVAKQLEGTQMTVCLGIDGSLDTEGFSADQIGLAINNQGILAVGRKFHPSPQERSHVNLCSDYTRGEAGYPRTFAFNGKTCFIAVCYDTYGIRQGSLANPGVDCVANLVHCFFPKGCGPSGEAYFAKHGFAGTSKQWGCPVFGTAVFYHRGMPERWPTGVLWDCGDSSTRDWRYERNAIHYTNRYTLVTDEGNAIFRIFNGIGWG
jgi:hypothetical protein